MGAQTNKTSPPSGNTNVPGLGESFSINLNTGQGVFSHKISLPPGVAGFGPRLTLEYSSSTGLDNFGWGWSMNTRSINRRLDFGVPGEGTSEHFSDNGTDIVPLENGTFQAEVENAFSRYTQVDGGWKVEERNGARHFLGMSGDSRIEHPGHPGRVFQWLLERSLDTSGNEVRYTYDKELGTAYLSQVEYAVYRVGFVYENREDKRSNARKGFLSERNKICTAIRLSLIENGEEILLKAWNLQYQTDEYSGISLLKSIQIKAFGEAADGSEDVEAPETTFSYSAFNPAACTIQVIKNEGGSNPPPLTDDDTVVVNLENAPLPGILQVTGGRQFYWRNSGHGKWLGPVPQLRTPFVNSFSAEGAVFADMNGSGWADMMLGGAHALKGYYENRGSRGWGNFIAYPRSRNSAPPMTAATRFTDITGSGTIDAVQSGNRGFAIWNNQAEDGWSNPALAPKTAEGLRNVDFNDRHIFLADMNGDGLQDIVRISSGRVDYWPNQGRGAFGEMIRMQNSPRLPELANYLDSVFLFDVNGDGCDDLVILNHEGLQFYINRNGSSFSGKFHHELVPRPNAGTIRVVDFNGEGKPGLLYNSWYNNEYIYVSIGGNAPNLLTHTDNGYGLVSEITYKPAVSYYLEDREKGQTWQTDFPFPLTVVSGTKETDLTTGQVTEMSYAYHDAHYDYRLRRFQGFGRVEKTEHGDESRPSKLSVHQYLMAQEKIPGNHPVHSALNGKLFKVDVFGLDGSESEHLPYLTEESAYRIQDLPGAAGGRKRIYLQVARHTATYRERGGDKRVEEKIYTYDDWGNIIREEQTGTGEANHIAAEEKKLITSFEYALNPAKWLLDKRSKIVVRNKAGEIVSETRQYYDGPAYTGLPLGKADRGLLSREEKMVWSKNKFDAHYAGMDTKSLGYFMGKDDDGKPAVFINHKRSKYDPRGLRTGEMNAMGQEAKIGFTSDGLYKKEYGSAIGKSTYEYDKRSGLSTKVTNPDGAVIRMKYDGLGRMTEVYTPDNTSDFPSRTYEYDSSSMPLKRVTRFFNSEDAGDFAKAVTYFDGKVKEIQSRIQTAPGQFAVTAFNRKNPWGDTSIEFEPFYANNEKFSVPSGAEHNKQEFYYDAMGRITKTINFNEGISTAIYNPFEVITADPNDHEKVEEFDVFRNRTRTRYQLEQDKTVTLTYKTDDLGQLVEIHDEQGRMASYVHDLLGNRLSVDHREAGKRSVWFNAVKSPVKGVDAKGNEVVSGYDAMGRVTELSANGSVTEEYTYDVPEQGAFGKTARVKYPGGTQSISYDRSGHIISKEYGFDDRDEPVTISFEYDRIGRKKAVIHDDGTKITYKLSLNGWVRSIPGVINDVQYDPMGNPTEVKFANGVITRRSYSAGGRKVLTQKTVNKKGAKLEDIEYVYNKFGQLTTVLDRSGSTVKKTEMTYNAMDQLLSSASVSGSGSGGASLAYTYNEQLNLLNLGDDTTHFHYDDASRPNQLTGLSTGAGPVSDLSYDDNGNLVSLPGKQFSFDYKNQLVQFESDAGVKAGYLYDHKGNRVEKTVDNGAGQKTSTYFIEQLAEYRENKKTFFVYLGQVRVAIIRDEETSFVHSDYLGNTAFFSDDKGTKIAAIAYRPYGNIVSSSGDLSYRTFGTHPFDEESGLYYMQKRYYSPETGRFISPDPVAVYLPKKVLGSIKSLHPYNYTGCDPLNNVDLSGLSFWSVVGGIVGVIAGVALVVFLGPLAAIIIGIAILSVSYALASSNANNDFGQFMRGFMIGFNAGLNAAIGSILFGPVIGIALGVINFLAVFDSIAENPVYKGILGWTSWAMPMSWLATGLGLLFFVINLVVAGVTFNQVDAVKIDSISVHWSTGMLSMEGGLITNPKGGFNMGNFSFIGSGHGGVTEHELGHGLSNAAFGSIFHFIGAIDENIIQDNPEDAYAEHLADSNDPARAVGEPDLDMWSS